MTMLRVALFLMAGISFLGSVWGLEWDNQPEDNVYACAGNRVTFPWHFKVGAGHAVVGVNWLHDGSLSSTMVATLARGHFVATGPYSARVQHVPNGGLVVEDLDTQDSGNYTVEVNVAFGGRFQTFRKTVYLLVSGRLTVEQDPEAWWDPTSQQWFLRLTCGTFPFPASPPVDVEWTVSHVDGESCGVDGESCGCHVEWTVSHVEWTVSHVDVQWTVSHVDVDVQWTVSHVDVDVDVQWTVSHVDVDVQWTWTVSHVQWTVSRVDVDVLWTVSHVDVVVDGESCGYGR
ncbi:hypothetical protein ACOMHN_015090 [Nucella lapillus]